MTANMNIDFRKPAVPERVYVYRAEIVRIEGRKAWVTGQMRCMDPFRVDEMLRRKAAASDEVSGEEEREGALVAEATALFVEPKFGKVRVYSCLLFFSRIVTKIEAVYGEALLGVVRIEIYIQFKDIITDSSTVSSIILLPKLCPC